MSRIKIRNRMYFLVLFLKILYRYFIVLVLVWSFLNGIELNTTLAILIELKYNN